MRFGICAPVRDVVNFQAISFDYLEEGVQRFLAPERSEEYFEEQLHAARSLPVPIEAANGLLPADLRLVATPDRPVDTARLERYMRVTLRRAARAGIRVLVFGSGSARTCPPEVDLVSAVEQIGAHLATWSTWAREYDIDLVLEPLSRDETNTLNTVAEAGTLVTRLVESGAKLLVDTYHMACNGEDPRTMLPFVPLIRHVHVAEYQERAAPGRFGEDFHPYFKPLHQGGYDRRISVECGWWQLQEEAERAVTILRKQWTAASAAPTNE